MNASLRDRGFRPVPLVASATVSPDIGLSEVAELLACSKAAATKYANLQGFPKPRQLARGRVWDRDAVKAWGKRNLPFRQGRPPKTEK